MAHVFFTAAGGCGVPGWLDMGMGQGLRQKAHNRLLGWLQFNHSRNPFAKPTTGIFLHLCSQPGGLILSGMAGAQVFSGNDRGLNAPRPFPALVAAQSFRRGPRGAAAASPCVLPALLRCPAELTGSIPAPPEPAGRRAASPPQKERGRSLRIPAAS